MTIQKTRTLQELMQDKQLSATVEETVVLFKAMPSELQVAVLVGVFKKSFSVFRASRKQAKN